MRNVEYTEEEIEQIQVPLAAGPNAFVPYEDSSQAYWPDALFEKSYGYPKPRTDAEKLPVALECMQDNCSYEEWKQCPNRVDGWSYFPMTPIEGFPAAFDAWIATQPHIIEARYDREGIAVHYRGH